MFSMSPLLASCLVLMAISVESAAEYAWPLDLPQVVTSSFGEFRTGRFHAGIDIRTGGIGQRVYAPADGYVSRLRCSPTGYGKAVYVQLRDGNTVTFGHLDDFSQALRDYVHRAQHEKETYTVDLYPESGALPVERGDLIGFSGQTGTGAPHLHYELRDPKGWPTNPCLAGITWPDTTPPSIHKVIVTPDGPDSTVNGDIVPVILEARAAGEGRYMCDKVRATGRIGFGAEVVDAADSGGGKLGVRTLRTLVGDTETFRIQLDRFSYENSRGEVVTYHPYLMDKGLFLLQWRWPGNPSEIFPNNESAGWYAVGEATVEIRLEAEDFLGNKSVVVVPVEKDVPPVDRDRTDSEPGKGHVDIKCVGTWLMVTAAFSAPEPTVPEFVVESSGHSEKPAFRRVSATEFRLGVVPKPDAQDLVLRVAHERIEPYERRIEVFQQGAADRAISIGEGGVRVKGQSPYGVLFVQGFPDAKRPASPIPVRGKPIRLWPEEAPLNEAVDVSFPMPSNVERPERLAVYRATGSSWSMLETKRAGDRLVAPTRNLGVFAIMEDNKAPVVTDIVPKTGEPTSGKRPTIRATVSDVGSGIKSVRVTCNGKWLLVAYDPERRRIEWEKDEDLPPGKKTLVFTVTDAAGNSTTATRKL